jgi:hypothetical protein
MSELRVFSYLPNPRIWKATIAARLCGIVVEVRGASPQEVLSQSLDVDEWVYHSLLSMQPKRRTVPRPFETLHC